MRLLVFGLLFGALLLLPCSFSTTAEIGESEARRDDEQAAAWVEAAFQRLSPAEKAGLTLMVPAYPKKGFRHYQQVAELIRQTHAGGVIVFQGGPVQTIRMIRYLQQHTPRPLMFALDAEWGAAMRLDSVIAFPKAMTLGALEQTRWTYRAARHIAQQLRALGIHVNFAPVVDINSNPQNPIIHLRSFGEDPERVTAHAAAYLQGMRKEGLVGVIKHFPGHGDTHLDSHKDLPVIRHSAELLRRRELWPFRRLVRQGVDAVMVGHLLAPALSPSPLPAPFDPVMVDSLLRGELGFQGVVFTDALNMKGATKRVPTDSLGVKAIRAGCDVLLMPPQPQRVIRHVMATARKDPAFRRQLDRSVRRILKLRYRLGLRNTPRLPDPAGVARARGSRSDSLLLVQIAQLAVSGWRSPQAPPLPPTRIDSPSWAVLIVNDSTDNEVGRMMRRYGVNRIFRLDDATPWRRWKAIADSLAMADYVIVSLHRLNMWNARTFGLSKVLRTRLGGLQAGRKTVVFNFGSPYALRLFPHAVAFYQGYEDQPYFHRAVVHRWAGAGQSKFVRDAEPSRHIPVTPFPAFEEKNKWLPIVAAARIFYCSFPEEAAVDPHAAWMMDTLIAHAIDSQAMPGCQVMAMADHYAWWWGARGWHTYDSVRPVDEFDLYDLASLTKVMATTLAVMKLYEENRIHLADSLGALLPEMAGTLHGSLTVEALLRHTSGLPAWVPFYRIFLEKEKKEGVRIFSRKRDARFSVPITPSLFMRKDYVDTLWQHVDTLSLRDRGSYRYSDLGMYYLHRAVERLTGRPIEAFLKKHFWEPMGMNHTMFAPFLKGRAAEAVPSEVDDYFRHDTLRGAVHDMAAAMLGGTAGHAGLFSNVHDVAKMVHLFLSGGWYGGRRYLQTATIERFTRGGLCPDVRRGLGFDKPACRRDEPSPAGELAPASSFGHSGFTGTYFWAAPRRFEFLRGIPYLGRFYQPAVGFVFLSNRTFPTMSNRRLITTNVRTRLFDLAFEAGR